MTKISDTLIEVRQKAFDQRFERGKQALLAKLSEAARDPYEPMWVFIGSVYNDWSDEDRELSLEDKDMISFILNLPTKDPDWAEREGLEIVELKENRYYMKENRYYKVGWGK